MRPTCLHGYKEAQDWPVEKQGSTPVALQQQGERNGGFRHWPEQACVPVLRAWHDAGQIRKSDLFTCQAHEQAQNWQCEALLSNSPCSGFANWRPSASHQTTPASLPREFDCHHDKNGLHLTHLAKDLLAPSSAPAPLVDANEQAHVSLPGVVASAVYANNPHCLQELNVDQSVEPYVTLPTSVPPQSAGNWSRLKATAVASLAV